MKLSVNVKGDKELKTKLKRIERHFGTLRPLYKSWGITVLKWIQQNYRSEGRKLKGRKWRRLRPLTIRGRRGGSRKPLLDTGHMLRQWHYRVRAWGVAVGNPMDIAEYHEEGTRPYTIKPKNKKALWFGVTPADRRRRKKGVGVFAKEVYHPGLPKRRQLPNEAEILPDLVQVADIWIDKIIRKENAV